MSEELFSKIDALMNRHRPGAPLPRGGGYLPLHPSIPTLTEIIEEPPLEPAAAPSPSQADQTDLFQDAAEPLVAEMPATVSLELDDAALATLERGLRNMLQARLAVQVARRVDLAMGEMLEGLRTEIEQMVHDAVEQELRQFAARQRLKQTSLE